MKKLIATAAFLLVFLLGLAGSSSNKGVSVTEYQLSAAQFPVYVAPDSPTNTAPREVSEWAVTNYGRIFSWEDSDGKSYSIHVTLPALEPVAKFATDYNSAITEYANDLLDNNKGASQNGECLNTCAVIYEAYLYNELLSILVTEQYDSGECNYQVSTFDLVALIELSTADLAERLLRLDYASFLLASNLVVDHDYIDRYYQEIHDPEAFIGELAFFSEKGANRVIDYIF